MHSDQALLAKIQAERNPTMAELEREHAIDLARAETTQYNRLLETKRDTIVRLTMKGKL